MTEFMHLLGSEEVQKAASSIRSSAEIMQQAARNFDASLEQHQRFLCDWIQRLEVAISMMPHNE